MAIPIRKVIYGMQRNVPEWNGNYTSILETYFGYRLRVGQWGMLLCEELEDSAYPLRNL